MVEIAIVQPLQSFLGTFAASTFTFRAPTVAERNALPSWSEIAERFRTQLNGEKKPGSSGAQKLAGGPGKRTNGAVVGKDITQDPDGLDEVSTASVQAVFQEEQQNAPGFLPSETPSIYQSAPGVALQPDLSVQTNESSLPTSTALDTKALQQDRFSVRINGIWVLFAPQRLSLRNEEVSPMDKMAIVRSFAEKWISRWDRQPFAMIVRFV